MYSQYLNFTYTSLITRRFLPTYVYLPFTFFFVSTLTWKKIKDYRLKQDINKQFGNFESPNFNNCMHNPAILTPVQYCVYFIVIGAAILLSLVITDKRLEIYPWLILFRNAPHVITIGIIVPLAFYIKNKRARNYIKREFWDWAPDYVQKYNPYQPKINIFMKSKINANDVTGRSEETNKVFEESTPDVVGVVAHSVVAKNDFVSADFFLIN